MKRITLDKVIRFALAAPLCVVLFIYGSTKKGSITYPLTEQGRAYLVDHGSYVTNDWVHIDFERRIVPDDANVIIDRRQLDMTNDTDWVTHLESTFAAFHTPTNIPFANATSWNWIVYTDWVPPPTVLTNGVLHVNWGKSLKDVELRRAGMAAGIPLQSTVWVNGVMVGTPGGTNKLDSVSLLDEERGKENEE